MEPLNYRVQFESFTERHYVRKFRKDYKDKWLKDVFNETIGTL